MGESTSWTEYVYPRFPDNVIYRIDDDILEDFLRIVRRSFENGDCVDPAIVLRCAVRFHEWSDRRGKYFGELKSRCIAACIEACLSLTDVRVLGKKTSTENTKILEISSRENFPDILLDKSRVKNIYDTIDVNHFVHRIAPAFKKIALGRATRFDDARDSSISFATTGGDGGDCGDSKETESSSKRYYWVADSKLDGLRKQFERVFFTMSMRWLINFRHLSIEARDRSIELYEFFAARNFFFSLYRSVFSRLSML